MSKIENMKTEEIIISFDESTWHHGALLLKRDSNDIIPYCVIYNSKYLDKTEYRKLIDIDYYVYNDSTKELAIILTTNTWSKYYTSGIILCKRIIDDQSN